MSSRSLVFGVAGAGLIVLLALLAALAQLPREATPPIAGGVDRPPVAAPPRTAALPDTGELDVPGRRRIALPEPGAPPPDPRGDFCDERNWGRLGAAVTRGADGGFRIDRSRWERMLASARVGLASWISECAEDGGRVTIVAADSGAVLAVYDARNGFRAPGS